MEKNICFTCKHVSEYPVCPAAYDDIVFASNGDTIVRCKAYREAEGDCKTDKKVQCFNCVHRKTPLCKYCDNDAEGGGEDG